MRSYAAASLRSSVLVILRLAGMMISPVSELTTSSGIFSPSRMLLSASVNSRSVLRLSRARPRDLLDLLRRSLGETCDALTSLRDDTLTSMTMP
jgi:hypothetical protein